MGELDAVIEASKKSDEKAAKPLENIVRISIGRLTTPIAAPPYRPLKAIGYEPDRLAGDSRTCHQPRPRSGVRGAAGNPGRSGRGRLA